VLVLSRSTSRLSPVFVATLGALAVAAIWDISGLDLPLAQLASGPSGFVLREHWLLAKVLHDGGRRLAWVLASGLCIGVWFPFGPLRRLRTWQRLRLAIATLAPTLAISLLKGLSPVSCPWDLEAFGGLARHVSHWNFQPDGGRGHCFPAGHASAGFSFMSGFFSFRDIDPPLARRWLALALAAGLLFGAAQQLRGAHFMSHTLWTGWICWVVAWAVHGVWPDHKETC
jgi:membrane-associated PAP2 superfamily phosphatase